MKRAPLPPEKYASLFVNNPEGAEILEELVAVFYTGGSYVAGGQEGDRATCYKLGGQRPILFILGKINQASGIDDQNAEE